MRILLTSDWHIRLKNPRYRIDDFYQTLMGKLTWLFELAKKENCKAILQGGDFFDSPDQTNYVIIDLINLFDSYEIPIHTVAGQHDLKHRQFSNTTLAIFKTFGCVNILDGELKTNTCIPCIDSSGSYNVNIYGSSWEEEVPIPEDKDALNILVIHKMIVKDSPLWAEQSGYTEADTFLNKHKHFSLVVSGDNHQSFICTNNRGQILINSGSLMRTTIAQREHSPCVYIYDSESRKVKRFQIPIKPIEEVMDLETADEQKERNAALEEFMSGLSIEYRSDLSFEENLQNVIVVNKTDDVISNIIQSFLVKWHDKNGGK